MKRIIILCLLVLFPGAASAFADWQVTYPEQLFVEPGQKAVVELSAPNAGSDTAFKIVDNEGKDVEQGRLNQGKAELGPLPQGYYELVVGDQRFGIVCLGAFCTANKTTLAKRDGFFCIDAAMAWLVSKEGNRREQLIHIARRSGISMLRERLHWGEVQPQDGPVLFDGKRGNYESLRKMYLANDVEVLELCHDAPDWPGKIGKYPDNLNKWADFWSVVAPRWESTWGGFEVWNEPDISFSGNLPADQYAPILKATSWKMAQLGMDKPLLGCCMATFNIDWLDNARENGVYEYCDAFSFHNYGTAPGMADLFLKFAQKVNGEGAPGAAKRVLPIWITECGRPWKRGKGRADAREDTISAVDIAMKAIIAKACGCQRYFPFVYPYYDENENNFGMVDKSYSPMRSFAGYVQLIRVLSGYEYLGDLPLKGSPLERCRAFASKSSDRAVLVLYTGDVDKKIDVSLPIAGLEVQRITGESAEISGAGNRTVTVRDGLVYVWVKRADLDGLTAIDPVIAQIPKVAAGSSTGESKTQPRAAAPVVPKYLFDGQTVEPSPIGYRVKRGNEKSLKVVLALDNLADQAIESTVYPPQRICRNQNRSTDSLLTKQGPQKVVCPAQGRATVEWTLDLSEIFDSGEYQSIGFRIACPLSGEAVADKASEEQNLVLRFTGEPDWDRLKTTLNGKDSLDIMYKDAWKTSQGANGKSTITINEESTGKRTWILKTEFNDGDCWTYPMFELPKTVDLTKYRGLLLKFRAQPGTGAIPRLFLYESDAGGHGAYMTTAGLGAADGNWRCAIVWFNRLVHCSAAGTDKNGQLNLDSVNKISIGGNTKSKSFELEVSDAFWIE